LNVEGTIGGIARGFLLGQTSTGTLPAWRRVVMPRSRPDPALVLEVQASDPRSWPWFVQ
jgi:hypothetical protein